jgi:hypothetical protein
VVGPTPALEAGAQTPGTVSSDGVEIVKPAATAGKSIGTAQSEKLSVTTKAATDSWNLPEANRGAAAAAASKGGGMNVAHASAPPTAALATAANRASSPHGPAASTPTVSPVIGRESNASSPVNRIDLRIHSMQGEAVDVRLVSHGDAVQVAVRTAAGGLANDLRDGLHDLVQTLKDTGYQSETWRPVVPPSASAGSRNDPGADQQRPSDGGGGGRKDTQGWQQESTGGRGQSDRELPRWVEELEANLAGPPPMKWRDMPYGHR